MEKYLFIGAHPDDIEFGAGSTLAKAIQSNIDCRVLVLSNCNQTLPPGSYPKDTLISESLNAMSELGLATKYIRFADYPVRNFPKCRQEILQDLIDLSRTESFTRVFIPCTFDIHQDHQVVSIEAIRAFKFVTMLGYELPWNNFQGRLRHFNVIDPIHVSMKKKAIACFKSQSQRTYSDETAVEATLRFRGLESGVPYAEAFEVIRWKGY